MKRKVGPSQSEPMSDLLGSPLTDDQEFQMLLEDLLPNEGSRATVGTRNPNTTSPRQLSRAELEVGSHSRQAFEGQDAQSVARSDLPAAATASAYGSRALLSPDAVYSPDLATPSPAPIQRPFSLPEYSTQSSSPLPVEGPRSISLTLPDANPRIYPRPGNLSAGPMTRWQTTAPAAAPRSPSLTSSQAQELAITFTGSGTFGPIAEVPESITRRNQSAHAAQHHSSQALPSSTFIHLGANPDIARPATRRSGSAYAIPIPGNPLGPGGRLSSLGAAREVPEPAGSRSSSAFIPSSPQSAVGSGIRAQPLTLSSPSTSITLLPGLAQSRVPATLQAAQARGGVRAPPPQAYLTSDSPSMPFPESPESWQAVSAQAAQAGVVSELIHVPSAATTAHLHHSQGFHKAGGRSQHRLSYIMTLQTSLASTQQHPCPLQRHPAEFLCTGTARSSMRPSGELAQRQGLMQQTGAAGTGAMAQNLMLPFAAGSGEQQASRPDRGGSSGDQALTDPVFRSPEATFSVLSQGSGYLMPFRDITAASSTPSSDQPVTEASAKSLHRPVTRGSAAPERLPASAAPAQQKAQRIRSGRGYFAEPRTQAPPSALLAAWADLNLSVSQMQQQPPDPAGVQAGATPRADSGAAQEPAVTNEPSEQQSAVPSQLLAQSQMQAQGAEAAQTPDMRPQAELQLRNASPQLQPHMQSQEPGTTQQLFGRTEPHAEHQLADVQMQPLLQALNSGPTQLPGTAAGAAEQQQQQGNILLHLRSPVPAQDSGVPQQPDRRSEKDVHDQLALAEQALAQTVTGFQPRPLAQGPGVTPQPDTRLAPNVLPQMLEPQIHPQPHLEAPRPSSSHLSDRRSALSMQQQLTTTPARRRQRLQAQGPEAADQAAANIRQQLADFPLQMQQNLQFQPGDMQALGFALDASDLQQPMRIIDAINSQQGNLGQQQQAAAPSFPHATSDLQPPMYIGSPEQSSIASQSYLQEASELQLSLQRDINRSLQLAEWAEELANANSAAGPVQAQQPAALTPRAGASPNLMPQPPQQQGADRAQPGTPQQAQAESEWGRISSDQAVRRAASALELGSQPDLPQTGHASHSDSRG
ncbi:hypothetical protein WJX74_001801 [Apatococcus lobatus]|uniref:Uncharacterized protein n=1 Tax=Apatococcus lobatus TaxID=904363 RepID=A0AAW1QTT2_9CHLO